MKFDFVSLGEVLIQFNPLSAGPLRYPKLFEVHVAGSESNILIGLSKLGFTSGLISRVGNDEFGIMILNTLKGEGIDISKIKIDDSATTGIYIVQRHYPIPGESTVFYYRHESAASKMDADDIDEDYIKNSNALIITGITPALSDSCYRAVKKAYEIAVKEGLDIIFDTNIRIKLWKDPNKAKEVLFPFLKSKIILTNKEDLGILFPNLSFEDSLRKIIDDLGAEILVIKMGEEGAWAINKKHELFKASSYKVPIIEDVIGAGDAFDAAFIASIYRGMKIEYALQYGAIAGALVITTRGDIEAQPTWNALETLARYMLKKEQILIR
ncbi:MAG: PfkB family carbohydrate kinase [Fervidicoccus sp.]